MFKIPLIRELGIVLLVKLIVIFSIKAAFFSNPVDLTHPDLLLEKHMGLATQTVEKQDDQ